MSMTYRGFCWKFGDNILNDGQIMSLEQVFQGESDPIVLAQYCMFGLDPYFPQKAKRGDIIVAGKNFGKGQLHIQGPLSIKGLGVGLVTESMSRSFFRLAVSAGVMMLPFCPGVTAAVKTGDALEVDFSKGVLKNLSTGTVVSGDVLPSCLLEIITEGGEREWIRKHYGKNAK